MISARFEAMNSMDAAVVCNGTVGFSTAISLPADFHSLWPYWKGAKPARVARSRYMPPSTMKRNWPPRLARVDWALPPVPSTWRKLTSERASGRPVERSSTTPLTTADCAEQQHSAANRTLHMIASRI